MASGNLGTIYYTVSADTEKLLDAETGVSRSMDRMTGEMNRADRASSQLSGNMNKLATAIKTVIAAQALRGAADLVQSYQEMAERVQMATDGTAEYELVQRRLLATANGTYRALEEAQELYIRTAASLRSMGYTTEQALDVTDSMSYAFVTNATSAERANAAINAFSKSMNTGRVAADQWETITTAIPSVIDDIATASGKSAAAVRELGATGKLTARDLSEGLRASLEQNSKAAADMANNLRDAGVRTRTAFQAVLVALEEQTGGLQAFTNGIIKAADAMLEFAGSQENIETLLAAATIAGASFAAVMAGRVVQSMIAFGATSVQAIQVAAANRAAALSAVELARAESVAAANALIKARAFAQATVGLQTHSAAAAALTVAETRAAAATTALSAAQRGLATTAGIATVAANGLRTAMAFLGGPTGLILLGAAALWQFGGAAKGAAPDVELLSKAVKDLSAAERELSQLQLARAIEESEKKIKSYNDRLKESAEYEKRGWVSKDELWNAERRVAIEEETRLLEKYNKRLAELAEADTSTGKPTNTKDPVEQTDSTEGKKQLQRMREQIELVKESGLARAQLQAIQRLGTEATKEEREEAALLAAELYALEEANDERKKSQEDEAKGTERNIQVIKELREELDQTSLSTKELALRKAELSLNNYATPEQKEQVRQLTAELELHRQKLLEVEAAKRLDPVMGAQATFDAEMEELRKLNEAKLIEDQRYIELKNQLEVSHLENVRRLEEERFAAQSQQNALIIASLNEIQEAGTTALTGLLSGTNNLTDAMQQLGAGILRHAVGALVEMGIQYVKSLVMGQTAQTAAAATAAATGAAMAASYAPAAAAASLASFGGNAAPAMAGIASTYGLASSLSLMGGRQYGGPVKADGAYRINENGAPEVFNAANGQQYMLPNTRGEVVSNKNATGGSGVTNHIQIVVDSAGQVTASSSGSDTSDAMAMAQGIRVVVVDEIERQSRQGGVLWRMQHNG